MLIASLAAHTVIIKGVKVFQNNVNQEYSDLDIMQMIGRAVSDEHSVVNLFMLSKLVTLVGSTTVR